MNQALQYEYLSPREAAAYLRCTTAALARYRQERRGPPFLRISKRMVRYSQRDLVEWLEQRRVSPLHDREDDNQVSAQVRAVTETVI